MNLYTSFDYLCNEPCYIPGIGNLKCPTLREIRKVTYRVFHFYMDLVTLTPDDYRILPGFREDAPCSLYELLLTGSPQILAGLLDLFLSGKWEFNKSDVSFTVFDLASGENRQPAGRIGNENFDAFRGALKPILGLSSPKENDTAPRFKNNAAKKLYEKLKQNKISEKQAQDTNYTLDNMILKYCTHNKTGINILNVWDMTYLQFISLFREYCNARQCDFNDLMAANTFSYKNSADYHPLEYIKKLPNN